MPPCSAGTSAPVDLVLVSSGGQYASEANITNTITNPSTDPAW